MLIASLLKKFALVIKLKGESTKHPLNRKYKLTEYCPSRKLSSLFRYAKWRSNPASEGQLKALEKMKKSQKDLDLKKLTRGQAANIMTRIIHGAQVIISSRGSGVSLLISFVILLKN